MLIDKENIRFEMAWEDGEHNLPTMQFVILSKDLEIHIILMCSSIFEENFNKLSLKPLVSVASL